MPAAPRGTRRGEHPMAGRMSAVPESARSERAVADREEAAASITEWRGAPEESRGAERF